jgi:hypothetical protein
MLNSTGLYMMQASLIDGVPVSRPTAVKERQVFFKFYSDILRICKAKVAQDLADIVNERASWAGQAKILAL